MRILDVLTSPWMIRADKLMEIRAVYQTHLRGPKIDWKAMRSQFGMMMSDGEEEGYQVENGVAIIPVKGVLSKGLSLLNWLFGGSSMEQIGRAFRQALADPAVSHILLDCDSPGGTVDGTEELANLIYNARGVKPLLAYTDGLICSACYWIASSADRIYISGDTVMVGSIAAVGTHIDQSEHDKMMGEKWTEITSGPYKKLASAHRSLSEKGAGYLQEQVDYLAAVFTESALLRNRGMKQERAEEISQGKIYIGKQAIEAGLVDGVSTLDDLIGSASVGATASNGYKSEKEEPIVDLKELKEKHPDLYAAALSEGKTTGLAEAQASSEAAIAEARAAGVTAGAVAERQRIADVRAQLIPGHEALIESLVTDGKTTGQEAAVKVLAAEKTVRAGRKAAFDADGNAIQVPNGSAQDFVPGAEAETARTPTEAGDKLDHFAKAIKAETKCTYSEALAKAKAVHPALAKVYAGNAK